MTISSEQAPDGMRPPSDRTRLRAAPHRRPAGSPRVSAVAIAVACGLATMAFGTLSVLGQSKTYTASATLLVLPQQQANISSVASLYDALSQGQIVESFQAVMSSSGFLRGALQGSAPTTGPSPSVSAGPASTAPIRGSSVSVTVVPSTSLVDVTAKASSAATAERAADAVAQRSVKTLTTTFDPYRITLVSSAAGTAKVTGTSKSALLGVVALLSLLVAVGVHQAARSLRGMRERRAARGRLTSMN